MGQNKIAPTQLRKHCKSQNAWSNRSNVANTMQDDNFILLKNTFSDAFLGIAEDIEDAYVMFEPNQDAL